MTKSLKPQRKRSDKQTALAKAGAFLIHRAERSEVEAGYMTNYILYVYNSET
jgi:hypothetical protein